VLEPLALTVVAVAVMAGVTVQRITGAGFAAVSAPALILLWGPVVGVQVVNALSALCSLLLLTVLWRRIDWRRTAILTLTALAATPAGVFLAFNLPAAVLQIVIGLVMITALFAVRAIARLRFIRSTGGAAVAGMLGGVANATVGQAGPVMGAYAVSSRWEITSYVASMQMCWFLVNAGTLLLKGVAPIPPVSAVVLCLALVVGYLVSILVAKLVTRTWAERCLLAVALVGSLLILGKGLLSLLDP